MVNYQIVIPARGGSKRFPGKNIVNFNGKPLIAHSIEYAISNGFNGKIWVNTDSSLIANISIEHGAQVTLRTKELAGDYIPTVDVLKYQLLFFKHNKIPCDAIILLQATNPIRPDGCLRDGIKLYEQYNRSSLATFTKLNKKFGLKNNNVFFPQNYKTGDRLQDIKSSYYENGLLYITSTNAIIKGDIVTKDVYPFIIDSIESIIDIDEPNDLILAQFVFNQLEKK